MVKPLSGRSSNEEPPGCRIPQQLSDLTLLQASIFSESYK
jgi:hypothetical protein